jgi:RNA polymerase sigma-70 factor (ECF subfamily)
MRIGGEKMGGAEPKSNYHVLEQHREYLSFLAQRQLDCRLQAKVDLSGVVQQTLFEAHQAISTESIDDTSVRLGMMRKILANNLADEIRKVTTNKKDVYREQSLNAAFDHSSAVLEDFLAAKVSSPSLAIRRDEQAVQLSAALNQLLPAEREAIMLKNWENKTLCEIAEQMGRTPAAVAGLLKRGLHKLREEFSQIEK